MLRDERRGRHQPNVARSRGRLQQKSVIQSIHQSMNQWATVSLLLKSFLCRFRCRWIVVFCRLSCASHWQPFDDRYVLYSSSYTPRCKKGTNKNKENDATMNPWQTNHNTGSKIRIDQRKPTLRHGSRRGLPMPERRRNSFHTLVAYRYR